MSGHRRRNMRRNRIIGRDSRPGSPGILAYTLLTAKHFAYATHKKEVAMDSPRKPSRTSKLVQAAALAAVLVPLGSVAVETSPITHFFSGAGVGPPATNNQLFDFGPYEFRLFFESLATFSDFNVTVDNQVTNQGAVAPRLTNFPGDVCVPIDPGVPANPCVDFFVTAPGPGANTWSGFY